MSLGAVLFCKIISAICQWYFLENLHYENIFNRGAVGALCQPLDERKEAGAMVTYENLFDFVIMLGAVITLVIYYIHKK